MCVKTVDFFKILCYYSQYKDKNVRLWIMWLCKGKKSMSSKLSVLSVGTYSDYQFMVAVTAAAYADGLFELATEYERMVLVLFLQYEAEQRIEKAAENYAKEMLDNARNLLDDLESDRYGYHKMGKEARHNAAMAKSNLYLAIRNAVYFD